MSNAFAKPSEFSSPEVSAHYPANKLFPVVPAPLQSYAPGSTILFRLPAYQNAFIDPTSFRVSGLLNIFGNSAGGGTNTKIYCNSSASSLFSKVQYSSGSQQETVDQYPSIAHNIRALGLSEQDRFTESVSALGGPNPNLGAELHKGALTANQAVVQTHSFSNKLMGSLADISKPIPANFNYGIEITLASAANALVTEFPAGTDKLASGVLSYSLTEVRLTYVGSETPMYRELFPNPAGVYHSLAYQTYIHSIPQGASGRQNITLPFTASSATNLILTFEVDRTGTDTAVGGGMIEAHPAGIGSISPNLTEVQLTYGSKSWPTNPLRAHYISEVIENNRIAMNNEFSGNTARNEMGVSMTAIANSDMKATIAAATVTSTAAGAFATLTTPYTHSYIINLDLSKTHAGRSEDNVYSGINLSSNSILSLNIDSALPSTVSMRAQLISETLITLNEVTNTMHTAF